MSGKTPGQALHESLRESAGATFGLLVSDFATWDQVPGWQRDRLDSAARDVIAAYIEANGGDPVDARAVILEATGVPGYAELLAERNRLIAEKPRWTERLGPVVACDHPGHREADRNTAGDVPEVREEADFLADAASLDTDQRERARRRARWIAEGARSQDQARTLEAGDDDEGPVF